MKWPAIPCVLAALRVAAAGAAEAPFELIEVPDAGRVVAAELLDVDGDGRTDLFTVSYAGLPPDETRRAQVHFQNEAGDLPDAPDWSGAVPAGAAAYDIADLPDGPGREIVFVERRRLSVLAFPRRRAAVREIAIAGAPTAGLAPDERGLDRLRVARPALGHPLRLAVPGLGEVIVLRADGEVLSRLETGARANYFMPPRPGPLISESEVEIYFDVPLLHTGDVDGDGRADLITSTRHEIRVFHQSADGTFPERASRRLALRRVTEEELIRGSGSVRLDASDLDGDGLVDLSISHTSGGLFRAVSSVGLHLNREGAWDLEAADQTFRTEGGFSTSQFLDLNGDGRSELLAVRIPAGVLEIIEFFVTRSIDTEVSIYYVSPDGNVESNPSYERSVEIAFDFDTLRPRGFIPTFRADVNRDGYLDFLDSGGGKELRVSLGGPGRKYADAARMKFDTDGRIRFGDFDGDGLTDLLIYDPRRSAANVRIAVNRGTLVGRSGR